MSLCNHRSFEFVAKHTPRDGASSVITTAPTHIPGLTSLPEPSHSHTTRDHAPSVLTSAPSPAPLGADDYSEVRSQATGYVTKHHDPYTENRYFVYNYITAENVLENDLFVPNQC